jgi:hypothetical protein
MTLDPDADRWDLPIVGFRVSQIWFSGQLYVIAENDRSGWTLADFPKPIPSTKIGFGGPFIYRSPVLEHALDARAPWATLVPVLELRGSRVASATADRQGQLNVVFEDGTSLSAGPDERYENWDLAGPESLILAAPPGGGDPRIAH